MDRLDDLRAKWHAATEKGKHHDAIKALIELEKLVPDDPLWSQRLAEAYRRTGRQKDAVDAFARAFERYFDRGFIPRAIAMAKLVKSLDAQRGDLLERHLAQQSRSRAPSVHSEAVPTPKAPRAAVLAPADGSTVDEVRFSDATASSLSFTLVEVGGEDNDHAAHRRRRRRRAADATARHGGSAQAEA